MDVLLLGEPHAASRGVDVEGAKRILLFTAALLTGASVAVAGLIGFVGLVVPHGVRLLLGPEASDAAAGGGARRGGVSHRVRYRGAYGSSAGRDSSRRGHRALRRAALPDHSAEAPPGGRTMTRPLLLLIAIAWAVMHTSVPGEASPGTEVCAPAGLTGDGGGTATPPMRIVSTSPSITESLFALGLGPRVVGVSNFCRYPAAALTLPKVGSYLRPDTEVIARLRPDLVLLSRGAAPGRAPVDEPGSARHDPRARKPEQHLFDDSGHRRRGGRSPARRYAGGRSPERTRPHPHRRSPRGRARRCW